MRRKRRFQRPAPPLGFNFTPLVDVMFLLTIFFMLVAKFTAAEQVPLDLPHPEDSRARVVASGDRVVINCRRPESGVGGTVYSLGPNAPEPLDVIAERLTSLIPEGVQPPRVVIRADRRIPYGEVRAVMRVIAARGIPVLNVSVIAGEGEAP